MLRCFKSISINKTESSNGAFFQEGELEYTFSLQGTDCSVHSVHSALYWNERCAWLPERVKSFWELEKSKDGYKVLFFSFVFSNFILLFSIKWRTLEENDDDVSMIIYKWWKKTWIIQFCFPHVYTYHI